MFYENKALTLDDIRPASGMHLKDLPSKLKLITQNLTRIENRITELSQSGGSEDALESLVRLRDHIKLYQTLCTLLDDNKIYLGNPIKSKRWKVVDEKVTIVTVKPCPDMRKKLTKMVG